MKNTILNDEIDISPLLKAKAMLDNAIEVASSELEKTGAIQCFEYCYELSWKTMKRILKHRGVELASPREVFREAALNGLIDNPEKWFEFIAKRNATSHTYNSKLSKEMFEFLPEFKIELDKFLVAIEGL